MMKKLIILLLTLLMCLPALAEEADLSEPAQVMDPFVLPVPEDVTAQVNPGGNSVTFVHGNGSTRVVAMVLSRVPDAQGDHDAELVRLMEQFSPDAQDYATLTLSPGFYGLMAVTPGALEGAGDAKVDQVTVMILWQTDMRGELLILSGYDMAGEWNRAWTVMDRLLRAATVDGELIVPPATEAP